MFVKNELSTVLKKILNRLPFSARRNFKCGVDVIDLRLLWRQETAGYLFSEYFYHFSPKPGSGTRIRCRNTGSRALELLAVTCVQV
jgi:hypothetical protein